MRPEELVTHARQKGARIELDPNDDVVMNLASIPLDLRHDLCRDIGEIRDILRGDGRSAAPEEEMETLDRIFPGAKTIAEAAHPLADAVLASVLETLERSGAVGAHVYDLALALERDGLQTAGMKACLCKLLRERRILHVARNVFALASSASTGTAPAWHARRTRGGRRRAHTAC